jgi:hypothetical protein
VSPDQRVQAELTAIRRELAEIKALLLGGSGAAAARGGSGAGRGGAVADDRDLDSDYGNFSIKRDPPRWDGQSYVGYKLSETEPAYLDVLASFKDWQADKDEQQDKRDAKGRPTAPMNRKDAARARGWATRLRNGWAAGGGGGGHANGHGAPSGGGYEQHANGFSGGDADDGIPF